MIRVNPCEATLGAVITGVGLAQLDDRQFTAIESAWLEHAPPIFPGQHLSDEAHLAFTRRFGRLEACCTAGIRGRRTLLG